LSTKFPVKKENIKIKQGKTSLKSFFKSRMVKVSHKMPKILEKIMKNAVDVPHLVVYI